MKWKPVHAYVIGMVVVATVSAAFVDWSQFAELSTQSLIGFGVLVALGLFSEALAFSHRIARESGNSSLVFLPLVACVILFGTGAGILLIAITAAIAEFAIRKKDFLRGSFNTAQYVLATALGGLAYGHVGGTPIATLPPDASFDPQAFPVLVFGVILFSVNHISVAVAISLAHRQRVIRVISRTIGKSGVSLMYDMLVLPVSIAVAFLYFELQAIGLLVSMLPLSVIRYSYLSRYRLELANRDLLRALVKAIEIRDPYTSGHSLRVQKMSEGIGSRMGLNERHLSELSAAALVHDIGKIEVIYEEIITKPGPLSPDEMKVIQSHVTRGVEILLSLSSVSPRIIRGVRHHHEKYDGTGYPDGLKGLQIPLEGRIIKICDAVDAMLSDRPYRKALSVPVVEAELRRCSGGEFDPELVELVIEHSIVAAHKHSMELAKALGPRDIMKENVTEVLITSD
jgi:putative nucleotidyltransferase with HDIG domain